MPVINNSDIQDLYVGDGLGAAILRSGKFVYNRYDYRKFTWTGSFEPFAIPFWVDGLVIFMQAGGGGGDAGGARWVAGWGGKAGDARVIEYTDIKRNWPDATHLYLRVGGGGKGGTDRGSNRGQNGAESYISLANYYSAQLPSESSEYRPIASTVNTVAGGASNAAGGRDGQSAPSITLKPREKRMTKSTTDTKSTGGKGGTNNGPGTWGAGGGGGHGDILGGGNGGKGGDGWIEVWMWGYYPPHQNVKVEYSVAGGYKVPVPPWATAYAYALFAGGAGGMGGSTTQGGVGGDSGSTQLGYGGMTAGSVATLDVTIGAGGSGGDKETAPSSGGATRIITNVTTQEVPGAVVNLTNIPEPTNGFGNGYNSITPRFAKFTKSTAGTPYRPCIGGAAGTEDSVDGKKGTKGGGGGGGYINGKGGDGADGYVAIWFWEADPEA